MSEKPPETLEELCDYIVRHAAGIFVRECVDGRLVPRSLAELPGQRAIHHAMRFVKEGGVPCRVFTAEEVAGRERREKGGEE